MSNRDYYADLGLTQHASSSAIKYAFHALAKKNHPDKTSNDDASAFRMVYEAYEKLSDTAFRAEYDRTYVRVRMNFDTDEVPGTRTAAFEAEEAERDAREERAAATAYDQAQFSGSALASSSAVPGSRAHGLVVNMTAHPCATEGCTLRTQEWRVQTGGADSCVFCMKKHEGGWRCLGCEALACKACFSKIIEIEQENSFGGMRSKRHF